ncbi:MAG: sulfur transferase domain-containing protein [Nitrospinae bacterium]|nr:sulfur transferase domain-containing protein [Nitrospinota bacterium]
MEYFNASEDIAFGSQPEPKDLQALVERGVKTIINTRFPEEDQGDLPPERAKAEAEALGMRYVNIPVSPVEFSPASLAEVSRALSEARAHGPTFVH